ncbi:MAG: 7-cyano-7-deazaguanine synthase QueC [bacterium]
MTTRPPAVVLLSGGLDSSTTLAVAAERGFEVHALTLLYGQAHDVELRAARAVARAFGVRAHLELSVDLRAIGGSALTDDIPVPKGRGDAEIGAGIPVTYVPARNTIFLSLALAWAEVLGATDLFLGVSAVDNSGYPDCRPEFVSAFERLANEATRLGAQGERFHVHAPLIDLDKAQTIELGLSLGVDYGLTWTCYDPAPGDLSCGQCDACRLRLQAFSRLGRTDPLRYADIGGAPPAGERT